jgi:hypothetical protein
VSCSSRSTPKLAAPSATSGTPRCRSVRKAACVYQQRWGGRQGRVSVRALKLLCNQPSLIPHLILFSVINTTLSCVLSTAAEEDWDGGGNRAEASRTRSMPSRALQRCQLEHAAAGVRAAPKQLRCQQRKIEVDSVGRRRATERAGGGSGGQLRWRERRRGGFGLS